MAGKRKFTRTCIAYIVLLAILFSANAKPDKEQIWCCTPTWKTLTIMAVGGTGAGILAWFGIPFAIAAAGFGTGGVVVGSLAAWIQAKIGLVAAGYVFAALQAAGAAGFTTAGLIAASTIVGVVAAGMLSTYFAFKCLLIDAGDSCGDHIAIAW